MQCSEIFQPILDNFSSTSNSPKSFKLFWVNNLLPRFTFGLSYISRGIVTNFEFLRFDLKIPYIIKPHFYCLIVVVYLFYYRNESFQSLMTLHFCDLQKWLQTIESHCLVFAKMGEFSSRQFHESTNIFVSAAIWMRCVSPNHQSK